MYAVGTPWRMAWRPDRRAGRQRCQAADDREDVLDAVRQLPCQQLACFLGLLSLVNVEGDADPLDDLAVRVMDGARATTTS